MKYEIKSVDAAAGTMSVRYFDDQDSTGIVLAVDLPIEDEAFPSGERLHQLISAYAPTYYFSRTRTLAAGVDVSHITPLIDQIVEI